MGSADTVRAATSRGEDTASRVADAAVTVVARDGFDVLSVRTVAREAGVSGGTVQHHYATRSQLLLAAFARTVESITARLTEIDLTEPLPGALRGLCRQLLPLDVQRHRECAVWAALSAAAASHPELAAEHARALNLLIDVLSGAIGRARSGGELPPGIRPAAAAAVLAAVVDGLTLHGIAGSRSVDNVLATLDATIEAVLR